MDTMETGVSSEKTESVSPVMKHVNEDTCSKNTTRTPPEDRCGTADVAKARWTLLRQVLRQKQVDSPEVQQVSVRRFSTFDLFTRRPEGTTQDSTTDGQWVEYTSVFSPEHSAFLMDDLGPLRVSEVLNSFDNTGNVCFLLLLPVFGLILTTIYTEMKVKVNDTETSMVKPGGFTLWQY